MGASARINRTIIIGDVHGCDAELGLLLSKLQPRSCCDRLIFLGDIMSKYGFNQENGGVMTFLNVLQGSDDEEVQKTAKEVRALVVPASMLPMVESMFGGGNKGGRDL